MARPLPKLSTFLHPPPPPRQRSPTADGKTGEASGSSQFASPYSATPTPRLPSFSSVSSMGVAESRPRYVVAPVTSSSSTTAASAGARTAPTTAVPATATIGAGQVRVRERTSRYLSEGDRRDIISRINAGEKQVTLAREYSVSRAAICNLYKNRKEVLTRSGRDLEAKHPKRQHSEIESSAATSTPRVKAERSEDSDTSCEVGVSPARSSGDYSSYKSPEQLQPERKKDFRVHQAAVLPSQPLKPTLSSYSSRLAPVPAAPQASTRSDSQLARYSRFRVHEASAISLAIRQLVGQLRDSQCVGSAFQQRAGRLMRLVVEDALTQLPSHEVEVQTSGGDICRVARPLEERDICGVSMEESGMALMLRAFSEVQPNAPTGIISLGGSPTSAGSGAHASPSVRAQLPPLHPRNIVLLLDVECATGVEACAALRHLVSERGISPATIYFVSVISSTPGLQRVHDLFPDVMLVTAQMDATLDDAQRIRPGLPEFNRRYWNLP